MLTATSKPMSRFWLALECNPSTAEVSAVWQKLLRDDVSHAHRFLVPESELATSYPHPAGRLPLKVVIHGPEDIVALDQDGTRLKLSQADVVVYRIEFEALTRAIGRAFALTEELSFIGNTDRLWQIGWYEPIVGYRFSVFFRLNVRIPS
jgi:hypothetical protein